MKTYLDIRGELELAGFLPLVDERITGTPSSYFVHSEREEVASVLVQRDGWATVRYTGMPRVEILALTVHQYSDYCATRAAVRIGIERCEQLGLMPDHFRSLGHAREGAEQGDKGEEGVRVHSKGTSVTHGTPVG